MLVRIINTRSALLVVTNNYLVIHLDRGTSGLCLYLIGTYCVHWRYEFSCKIHSDYFFADFN